MSTLTATPTYAEALMDAMDHMKSATPINRQWWATWINQDVQEEQRKWQHSQELKSNPLEQTIQRLGEEQKELAAIAALTIDDFKQLLGNTKAPSKTLVTLIEGIFHDKKPLSTEHKRELHDRAATSRQKLAERKTPRSETFGEYLVELKEEEGRELSNFEILRQLKERVQKRDIPAELGEAQQALATLQSEKPAEKTFTLFNPATLKETTLTPGNVTVADIARIERGEIPSADFHAEIIHLLQGTHEDSQYIDRLQQAFHNRPRGNSYTPPHDPVMDPLVELSGNQGYANVPQGTPGGPIVTETPAPDVKHEAAIAAEPVKAETNGAVDVHTNGKPPAEAEVAASKPTFLKDRLSARFERPEAKKDVPIEVGNLANAFIAIFRQTDTALPSLDVATQRKYQPGSAERFQGWGLDEATAKKLYHILAPGKIEPVSQTIIDALPPESRHRELLVKYNEAIAVLRQHINHTPEGIGFAEACRNLTQFYVQEKNQGIPASVKEAMAMAHINERFDAVKATRDMWDNLVEKGQLGMEAEGNHMPTTMQHFNTAYKSYKAAHHRATTQYTEALQAGYDASRLVA